mgnify:CR=1 FL=1
MEKIIKNIIYSSKNIYILIVVFNESFISGLNKYILDNFIGFISLIVLTDKLLNLILK